MIKLPDVSLITSQGYILSITEQAGVPNAGDTQYTLDVDQVTVETSDDKLAVALTAAGGAPNFLRTFDVTVDDTTMAEYVMDTLNQARFWTYWFTIQEAVSHLLYDSVKSCIDY